MAKRTLDIGLGAVLALLTLPFVIVVALALAVTFRSWPFFMQTRIGKDGHPFCFVKLRTLPTCAPEYADKYEIADIHRPWLPDLLRRTHLDELPQLWLVVVGRMSLVGPRPEMPNLHAAMDPSFATARTSVRPGVTGLWQISDQADRLIAEAPELDLAYLRGSGVLLDLRIVAHTVLIALGLAAPVAVASITASTAPVGFPRTAEVAVPQEAASAA